MELPLGKVDRVKKKSSEVHWTGTRSSPHSAVSSLWLGAFTHLLVKGFGWEDNWNRFYLWRSVVFPWWLRSHVGSFFRDWSILAGISPSLLEARQKGWRGRGPVLDNRGLLPFCFLLGARSTCFGFSRWSWVPRGLGSAETETLLLTFALMVPVQAVTLRWMCAVSFRRSMMLLPLWGFLVWFLL